MKQLFITLAIIAGLAACKKSDDDNTTPTQTIVTSDSSNLTGRLIVNVYDINNNTLSNAKASLFLSYSDVINNIPLYTLTSNSSGKVDFGFVREGNYYLTGISSGGTMRDTTVAQVLPQRTNTRKLILE